VGKSENEMRRVIQYHERMIEAAIDEAGSGPIEGAGTRVRESYHGGDGGDVTSVLDEIGLPTKS
jgi:hypothetical protein